MDRKLYILSAKQISVQTPLTEDWMQFPLKLEGTLAKAADPDFRQFVSAGDARRMGRLLKRAVATSVSAMREGGIEHPDAIITGTGFGSIENTELFLNAMVFEGEQMLKPTQFMQSTHNTTSSLIGIHTGSHGYNSTYSQKSLSFDSALFDAWLQFRLGKISNALVGSHDEMSPLFSDFMLKAGYAREPEVLSETAVSILLGQEPASGAYCTLEGLTILDSPDESMLAVAITEMTGSVMPDAIMTGRGGNVERDAAYGFLDRLLCGVPQLAYKPLFGVSFSSSAIGFYAAACCLRDGVIPSCLTAGGNPILKPGSILVVNVAEGRHVSVSLLKAI